LLLESEHAAAAGQAGAALVVTRRSMFDDIAWQCLRQRPAGRLAILGNGLFCCRHIRRAGLGEQFIDVGQRQFQLLDLRAQLLRRAPERQPQQLRQSRLERLDRKRFGGDT